MSETKAPWRKSTCSTSAHTLFASYKCTHFQNTAATALLLSVCSCRHLWVCWTAFWLAGKRVVGVTRHADFGVFRCDSAFLALCGVFQWFLARAHGEIGGRSAHFDGVQGRATTPSNGRQVGPSREQKASVVQPGCQVGNNVPNCLKVWQRVYHGIVTHQK